MHPGLLGSKYLAGAAPQWAREGCGWGLTSFSASACLAR